MNFELKPSDNIFIAGASGMVGSSIHRNLIKKGYGCDKTGGKISIPSRSELNLLNKGTSNNTFRTFSVINCIKLKIKFAIINFDFGWFNKS